MTIIADTNVLVRAVVVDDAKQARIAQDALRKAQAVAVSVTALCEFVWVLRSGYGVAAGEIAAAVRQLLRSKNVVCAAPAVEAGLVMLEAGGDFADGVIAFEGAKLGGVRFASFDKDAVRKLKALGQECVDLGA